MQVTYSVIGLIQDICNQVQAYFTDCLHFSQLAPQTAIFGSLFLLKISCYLYSNFKYTITENTIFLSFNNFLNAISKVNKLERRLAVNNQNKC